eukprot:1565276-Rhodomonas_salina.3
MAARAGGDGAGRVAARAAAAREQQVLVAVGDGEERAREDGEEEEDHGVCALCMEEEVEWTVVCCGKEACSACLRRQLRQAAARPFCRGPPQPSMIAHFEREQVLDLKKRFACDFRRSAYRTLDRMGQLWTGTTPHTYPRACQPASTAAPHPRSSTAHTAASHTSLSHYTTPRNIPEPTVRQQAEHMLSAAPAPASTRPSLRGDPASSMCRCCLATEHRAVEHSEMPAEEEGASHPMFINLAEATSARISPSSATHKEPLSGARPKRRVSVCVCVCASRFTACRRGSPSHLHWPPTHTQDISSSLTHNTPRFSELPSHPSSSSSFPPQTPLTQPALTRGCFIVGKAVIPQPSYPPLQPDTSHHQQHPETPLHPFRHTELKQEHQSL